MTRRGFSLIEVIVVLAIVGLLASIVLPSLNRARELSRKLGKIVAAELPEPPPTVEDMEEVAEDAADEHDIYDRVVALTENVGQLTVRISGVLDSPAITVRLWSNADVHAVQVHINGKMVHEQFDGEIRTYLGMGEWEHLLGEVERKVPADREEMFRSAREIRFGPLPGWGAED